MVSIMLPRATVAATRIDEVLETDFSIVDVQNPKHFNEPFKGLIEFQNVSFRYPGAEEDVLSNISFSGRTGSAMELKLLLKLNLKKLQKQHKD